MDKNISNKIKTNYTAGELDITYLTLKVWMQYIEEENFIQYDRHLTKVIRREFNRICILRKEFIKRCKNDLD